MPVLEDDKELKAEQQGGLVIVKLHRPEALNALTLDMIRLLNACLTRWEADPSVRAILFKGAGDRAFCAGGDIKAAYSMGMRYRRGEPGAMLPALYFEEEYNLNSRLFRYKKPLIAFMDGITMGGGFGIAGPCRYRIATPKTQFAMPEVGIGFFPDVGSMWFLSRAPGYAGEWLALTGNAIGASDSVTCHLATHFMPEGVTGFEALCAALAVADEPASILMPYEAPPQGGGVIAEHREVIDRCFAAGTVEEIMQALAHEGTDWAVETTRTMGRRAPVSLKVSLVHLRQSKGQDFDEVLARDYVLLQHFLNGHDFYEGVRAQVIDKDRNPRWAPESLEDVTEKEVSRYFEPLGKERLKFLA